MVGIRRVLALGLLLGSTGCASLQRGGFTQAPPEHDHAIASTTIDPFHPPVESTGTRMSRFFPGLARHERSSPAIVDSLRKGGSKSSSTDSDLRAVPRPEVDFDFDGDDTSSLPSRGSRSGSSTRPTRSEPDPLQRVTSAERPDDREIDDEAPLLQASMVAEVDPADTTPEIVIEPPRTREQLEARMASAALSPRRLGPVNELSPESRQMLPPRDLPVADSREQSSPEDRQTRRARVRDDENPNRETVKPLLAVAQILPDADQPEAGPPPMDGPVVADETVIVEPTVPVDRVADAAPVEPLGEPIADAPPAIEEPAVADRDQPEQAITTEPEPGDNPATNATDRRPLRNLAGRPRLALVGRRNDLPPDVPGPLFPRSYYGKDPLPQDRFPLDEQTEPGRWTWRPRLLQRLRGR